jgi:hypothetical protein
LEKRLHSRVSLEPQCKARFQLGGQSYDSIRVSNLGADGCCIQIPARSAGGLSDKTLLEGWEFLNPGLPKGSITAKVAWVGGDRKRRTGFVATGIKFLNAPVEFTRRLSNYVSTVARPLSSELDEMDEMDEMPDVPE